MMLAFDTVDAGVLRVEQDGSGEFLLIQDAVDAAAHGDTILIGPGRYDDLQPRGDNNVVCVARWDDNRDLTFIGEGAGSVIIGPTNYELAGTGPQGFHQHEPADIRVENMTFENLRFCIVAGRGNSFVKDIQCVTGEYGVFFQDADTCIVENCSFSDFSKSSVGVFGATHAVVERCDLEAARIYFGDTPNAVVRDCAVVGGGLAKYYMSGGLIANCRTQCGDFIPCVSVSLCDTIGIFDSVISGGGTNLTIGGSGTVVQIDRCELSSPSDYWNIDLGSSASLIARNNHFRSPGGNQLFVSTYNYPEGNTATVDLGSNYWHEDSTPARLDSLIHDGHDDPELHIFVNYEPILTEPVPVEESSFGGVKALFR